MATEPVRIPRAEFGRRRGALSMDLEQRGLDGWIACGDERPFSGGDHVRWLSDFQAHFEPVAVAGRGAEALLLTGPESAGLAELDLAGTGLTEVRAAREFSHPGLAYGSIDLAGGADALRAPSPARGGSR